MYEYSQQVNLENVASGDTTVAVDTPLGPARPLSTPATSSRGGAVAHSVERFGST